MEMLSTLKKRLLARIIEDTETGCWEWQGAVNHNGYGVINERGKVYRTHRASYLLFNGEIPDGLLVRHTCDNRSCVNPDHLIIGTVAENQDDMSKRGRHVGYRILNKANVSVIKKFLERHPIKRGNSGGHVTFLARWFGVSPSTIRDIKQQRTWRSVA